LACNAPNSILAGAAPQTPLRELPRLRSYNLGVLSLRKRKEEGKKKWEKKKKKGGGSSGDVADKAVWFKCALVRTYIADATQSNS